MDKMITWNPFSFLDDQVFQQSDFESKLQNFPNSSILSTFSLLVQMKNDEMMKWNDGGWLGFD